MSAPDKSNRVAGFVPGIVTDNKDPLTLGRIKVMIPNLVEPGTGYWIMPACWPGAGGENRGTQYPPPPIGAQVFIIFEQGRWDDPETSAIYLTGMYGLKDGEAVGPEAIYDAPDADRARKRACLWEDDTFTVFIATEDQDKRLVMQTKDGAAVIEIDANAGAEGSDSKLISIECRTGITIFSKGLIDISGSTVQIQGRRVIRGRGGKPTI